MAPEVVQTWTRLCESKHPHPVVLLSCGTEEAELQEILITSSLRLMGMVSTSLLPLDKLAKQLSLGGQDFRNTWWWGWRLLRSATTRIRETLRITTR